VSAPTEDVAAILAAASSKLAEGVTLFAEVLPDGPPASTAAPIVAVISGLSLAPEERFGRNLPAFDRPTFVVAVRSTAGPEGMADPRPARILAGEIVETLTTAGPSTRSGSLYHRFDVLGLPVLVDRDRLGRVVYEVTVNGWRTPSTGNV